MQLAAPAGRVGVTTGGHGINALDDSVTLLSNMQALSRQISKLPPNVSLS
jgi:hypothetical protein